MGQCTAFKSNSVSLLGFKIYHLGPKKLLLRGKIVNIQKKCSIKFRANLGKNCISIVLVLKLKLEFEYSWDILIVYIKYFCN